MVVTVGTLAGSAVKRTGKVARKGTDLIVYTLKEGQGTVDETGATVRELVGRLKMRGGGNYVSRVSKKGRKLYLKRSKPCKGGFLNSD